MANVICVGTVVYDQVFWVPTIPSAPVKVLATAHGIFGGGLAATAAIAIASLGGQSTFVGRVGRDAAGDALRFLLQQAGVDVTTLRSVEGGQTATSALLVDPEGERLLAAFPGAKLDIGTDWLPLSRIAEAGCVVCDIRWTEGSIASANAARLAGVPTVLDAELAPAESVSTLIRLVDHVIFSEPALRAYTGLRDHAAALRRVKEETPAQLGVTLGRGGVVLLVEDRIETTHGHTVIVRDTNGAGDVFHGAYGLAIAEGAGPREAATFANAAAAVKCSLRRGWHGMPSRDQVTTLLKEPCDATLPR
jgi:sulfofructose kinase